MENNYLQVFKDFDKALQKLSLNNKNISNGINARYLGFDEEDEKQLLSLIKKYGGAFSGGDDSGDSASSLSLETILDMSYDSKIELIHLLNAISKRTDNLKLKKIIRNLVDAIKEIIDNAAKIVKEDETEKLNKIALESLTYPFASPDISEIEKKLYEIRKYAFNKAKDDKYFPTQNVSIDTSKFDSLSRQELQSMYMKENFFRLSREDVKALIQATANEYLISNGVSPCNVNFVSMKMNEKSTQFGEYSPNEGVININSKLLDLIDEAKSQNNPALAYRILTTCIHEARHRVQFANLDKSNLSKADQLVAKALLEPQTSMTYKEYLGSLDEIDARNASYEYLKQMALDLDSEDVADFYNVMKKKEMQNGKKDIAEELKGNFSSVYGKGFLETDYDISRDMSKLNALMASYKDNCGSQEL